MKTRAIIKLHYDCNNNCIFCHASGNKIIRSNHELLKSKLIQAQKLGIGQIILSGGEPTIYPGLEDLMQTLDRMSFSSGFISNGRMFYYKEFTQRILNYPVDYFYISLHSHIPGIHDKITGSDNSWKQAFGGIKNILELSRSTYIELTVNCVLNHYNIKELNQFVIFLHGHGIKKIKFSLPDIKGNCLINKNLILKDLIAVSKQLNSTFETAAEKYINVSYDGIPPCFIKKEYRDNINDLKTNSILYMSEVYEDRFYPVDEGVRCKSGECVKCFLNNSCPGLYRNYKENRVYPVIS
jgi:MoaA/NifB/PqqE/SkfB family radical SAM enzyme